MGGFLSFLFLVLLLSTRSSSRRSSSSLEGFSVICGNVFDFLVPEILWMVFLREGKRVHVYLDFEDDAMEAGPFAVDVSRQSPRDRCQLV